jgi:integrase
MAKTNALAKIDSRPVRLSDTALSRLASMSPAAAYVRTLTTDAGRRSTAQAISTAAELLAPGSVPAITGKGRAGNAMERFAAACALPWHTLNAARLGELRASLVRSTLAPATVNKVLAAVRGVLEQCWRQNLVDMETLERAKSAMVVVKASTTVRGRHLSRIELAKILSACSKDTTVGGARDGAVVALLAIGLRRAEVASIRMQDFDPATGRLVVRGKGNKERIVFLTNGSRDAVDVWLDQRGRAEGALLAQVNRHGKVVEFGVTPQAIYTALAKRAGEAGVTCTPHDLRRTFAGEALSAGVDVATVQAIMGHSSPATTARYDRRPEDTKRKAMEAVAIPYTRSK